MYLSFSERKDSKLLSLVLSKKFQNKDIIGKKLPEIARNFGSEIVISGKFRKFSVLAQSRRVCRAFQFLRRVHRGDLRSLTLKTPCSKESLKSNSMSNSVALRENKEPPKLEYSRISGFNFWFLTLYGFYPLRGLRKTK